MKEFLYDEFFQLEQTHWWFRGRRSILFRLIERYKPKPDLILDAGCGTGYMATELSRFGQIRAFDFSEAAVRYTRRRGLDFVKQGSLTAIPYPSETFGLVTALDVIEHIEDDRSALMELRRVLKADGTLVITVPAFNLLWSPHDDVNLHKRRYTARELREKVEGAGLRVQRLSYYNFFLFPPILLMRLFRKAFPAAHEEEKSDFSVAHGGFINTALQMVLSAESRLIRFVDFPFGVSLVCIATPRR